MYFQSYGLNVSVIEERHLNKKKKKTGTDFFVKEEEESIEGELGHTG